MQNPNIVVVDNGTGYTKIGYAGNFEPSYVLPTAIAERPIKSTVQTSKMSFEQLDFMIGDSAESASDAYLKRLPMGSGTIQDWDSMEKYWHRLIYNYLRCDPEYFKFILTEPPMNPPENREKVAEIFFETFGVEGLYIGVQAVLALYGGVAASTRGEGGLKESDLTGTVVDSGDGVTHVIPIADGYVIGTCIKHIPLAGREITKFIEHELRERKEPIPDGEHRFAAQKIKEKYSYVAKKNVVAELNKYDEKLQLPDGSYQQNKLFELYEGRTAADKKPYQCWVGYERFMGPEIFFHPEFVSKDWRQPLDQVIDNAIQSSPIHVRRRLYKNIVLSGGSTTIKNLDKRLEREIQKRVDGRLEKSFQKTGAKVSQRIIKQATPIDVNILQSISQKYAVWLGGSLLGAHPGSDGIFKTRAQYEEEGPSVVRHNPVFSQGM